jgi:hypothetical protein
MCPVRIYHFFSTLSPKRHKFTQHKTCFDFLYHIHLKHLILTATERLTIKYFIGRHVKYPLFLSDFNKTSILRQMIRKTLKYQISWRSVEWEPVAAQVAGYTTNTRDEHQAHQRDSNPDPINRAAADLQHGLWHPHTVGPWLTNLIRSRKLLVTRVGRKSRLFFPTRNNGNTYNAMLSEHNC